MTTAATTAFGAALAHPARTAAVLRARASAAGLALAPVGDLDACAAVLAAHCWALATGRESLSGSMSAGEAPALAAALARASGHGSIVDPQIDPRAAVPDISQELMAAVHPVALWAMRHGGVAAVGLASADLGAGTDPRVARLASFLAVYDDADVMVL